MTPAIHTSQEPPDYRPADGARKAVLVCPTCDHESLLDGDWILRTVGDHEIRRCPECKSAIERRPLFDDHRRSRALTVVPLARAFRAAVVGATKTWRTSVSRPLRLFRAGTATESEGSPTSTAGRYRSSRSDAAGRAGLS